ncbi:hypothetical protein C0Q44_11875 [Paenibacillus sp. PCH8]|uniref:hypothetical protein n=1 Tax=Paenibacillus sp. PCH8 TaxID=2066524 RepID=UPI000CF9CBC0|nr:hypothetical protein [Paenibacillus sp. PCH8]PQP85150.1 hypothetical protein C0Q44_11875 [Paenibacillus sp. PCH8]
MNKPWHASIQGAPWNSDKMHQAVQFLRHRATVSFRVGVDTIEDLNELDANVFSARPDLILYVSNMDINEGYTPGFLARLAQLKHVSAMQLALPQAQDLTILGALEQMQFLKVNSTAKAIDLDFIRYYKQLNYLELHGKFKGLASIGTCLHLNTIIFNCPVETLEVLAELPMLQYLSLDSCELKGELDVLKQSTIRMLKLSSVRKLLNIQGLEQMQQLEFLHLSLPKLEQLCDFSNMSNLRQLELDYMKSLRGTEQLWTAGALEAIELKEINTALKAESFARLTELEPLLQVDFRFIDVNKGRIAAMRKYLTNAGKSHVLYENIPEHERIQSMAIEHLAKILM